MKEVWSFAGQPPFCPRAGQVKSDGIIFGQCADVNGARAILEKGFVVWHIQCF